LAALPLAEVGRDAQKWIEIGTESLLECIESQSSEVTMICRSAIVLATAAAAACVVFTSHAFAQKPPTPQVEQKAEVTETARTLKTPTLDDLEPASLVSDGGLVDAKYGHLYVMSAKGGPRKNSIEVPRFDGLEAVRLEDGKSAWKAKRASRPLGVVGKYLIAQSEPSPKKEAKHLRLVVLTRSKGNLHCDLKPEIPQLLHTRIDDSLRTSLRTRLVQWKGKTYVSWTSYSSVVTGMKRRPSPYDHKATSGLVRIDAEKCEATKLKTAQLPGTKEVDVSKCEPDNLKQAKVTLHRGGRVARFDGFRVADNEPQRAAWGAYWVDGCKKLASSDDGSAVAFHVVGTKVVTLRQHEADGETKYRLDRWEATTGKKLESVALAEISELGHAWFSSDGHVALAEVVRDKKAYQIHWYIYSVEGTKVAKLTQKNMGLNFVVANDRVVVDRISVYDTDSGKLLFSRAVRETGYAGPKPP
jgi:hypothetical protein